ncbi:MAG TPA: hypothetical protein VNO30_08710 [Kofleriaceae bacterium]|nr:hypothetical protein [Kofleriaceae bacterium]
MTAQSKPGKPADPGSPPSPTTGVEDGLGHVLGPFQAASAKFLQATQALQEASARQQAQAWLNFVDEARRTEHEAHQATMAVMRKHLEATSRQQAGSPEELFSARARTQLDHETELRQIHTDTQAKLTALSQKTFSESGNGDALKNLAPQRQEAYQAYLTDLQHAWAGVKSLDPQTVYAIASTIMFTLHAANQGI